MVHAKVVNIDGKTTFMGSANLNKQGSQDLEETNLLVSDENCAFTSQVVAQFQKDKADSKSLVAPPAISFNNFRAFMERSV
jgi:phosphatidylserine/phosphatidylglycerophosphate/cardiolipin synthase-like enzyme